MYQFFGELKDYIMQKYDEAEKFELSEKYTLEYLIALIPDVLKLRVKRVDVTIVVV